MNIGILGTGEVGRKHAEKLVSLGHNVMIGTRNQIDTLAKKDQSEIGNQNYTTWQKKNSSVLLGTFAEAAEFGDIVFDVLKGNIALEILKNIPNKILDGKILIDVANPLDFSKGLPPTLSICSTDSLGEQIQRALPNVKVIKTFNTMGAHLQTHPEDVADADHTIFLCGNDDKAKAKIIKLLEDYGWKEILDLGNIVSARGMELLLPLWLEIWNALGSAKFNFKVVR